MKGYAYTVNGKPVVNTKRKPEELNVNYFPEMDGQEYANTVIYDWENSCMDVENPLPDESIAEGLIWIPFKGGHSLQKPKYGQPVQFDKTEKGVVITEIK